ncbi:DUF6624 domain-containing protein [Streptantibioticus ferralitis]|uniref:Uncharacterized protein n=1 Tax=Streptantibioticus ferralitis TaxID=236510 RepID=A0ABT5Z023_9ACTN|nr:DUF6624 domain-containing protein [Streptantibioticus ferralitis]MDF2257196.1 hypothetical protein [Streptantibioticus ferralitis]
MTTEPRRPDIACDLLARAEQAREHWYQLVRTRPSDVQTNLGRHLDHANAAVLRRIVADHGWPGRSLVGEDAAKAAWEIALRADHLRDFQRLALRLLSTAVERGEAPIQQWAHLHDRCSVNAGAVQLYGTQYRTGPHGPEVLPVRDTRQLDARRASVGLPPFAAARDALRRRHEPGPEADPEQPGDKSSAEFAVSVAA